MIGGIVRAADKLDWEVVGFCDGFEGLFLPGNSVVLEKRTTLGIMPLGGTILGTTNKGHFILCLYVSVRPFRNFSNHECKFAH